MHLSRREVDLGVEESEALACAGQLVVGRRLKANGALKVELRVL